MFNAMVVTKDDEGNTSARVQQISEEQLPEGNVTVDVDYSTVNYKDGLCLGPGAGLVKTYPHVPGIDFAGTVEASDDPRYNVGDKVVLTGWRVGEVHWGGYAQKARVDADWLVALPDTMSTKDAMAVGTAGLSAMLGILTLEDNGLSPDTDKPVLVTGASGGVGSIAVAILSKLGYQVAAVTGRPETAEYLTSLGATQIVPRDELSEAIKRPLESESWAGCIDAVGGEMLARTIGQIAYGGTIAAIGNTGGVAVPANVLPFLLRGIKLIGIDSARHAYEGRLRAWQRLGPDLDKTKLAQITSVASLSDLPELGKSVLSGGLKGRVVVDVNSL